MTDITEPSDAWRDQLAAMPFEEAYRRLEDTVSRLEQGELSLTDAERLYREGMELAGRCQELLTETELRITQIGDGRASAGSSAPGIPISDDDWEPPPPLEPDDPSLFDDDDPPF
ncbi:MAG: exodeoxyribonuclease VII small subunit [Chloroflexota bacterium]|nr:exodeoxyribonuclease VII small subunit [Chloroflexota bacterium]MDE2958932.1 exodeoxyribonuclease VII small subunit [Chloroflexota bacterium]